MTSKRPKIPPKIECMDLNGGNRRPVINFDENQHPYGVTLTKNHVYWTDWKKQVVFDQSREKQNESYVKKSLVKEANTNSTVRIHFVLLN